MKYFIKMGMLIVVALGFTRLTWADSGNQLMQNQIHWYQKAADTVGTVKGLSQSGDTQLVLQPGSSLYIEGDSTLHPYQMMAHTLQGSALIQASSTDWVKSLQSGKIDSMVFEVPLADFKSRESGLDENAHKALKIDENPNIRFDLTHEKLTSSLTPQTYLMSATGTLSIAGVTQPVTLTADATLTGSQICLKGIQKLKMTDFKIVPPSISLLVTSITCADEIEVHYDVIFGSK